MTDRIAGIALLAVSLGYVWLSTGYQASYSDPLGPALFPRVVGLPAIILSLMLVVWPRHRADWAGPDGLARQAAALALLVGYAVLLEPVGFVPTTFAALLGLSLLMGARPLQGLLTAAIAAPVLYLLFDRLMGLPLPLLGRWIT